MQNYFTLLGLSVSYPIDEAALQRAYIGKQREFHPDKQSGKDPVARQKALLQSMDVNAAYQALKHPVRRAEHLLALNGVTVNSEMDSHKPDMALLMESMQMREALEQATDAAAFAGLRDGAHGKMEAAQADFSLASQADEWNKAASLAMRMRYLEKFLEEVRLHQGQKLKMASSLRSPT